MHGTKIKVKVNGEPRCDGGLLDTPLLWRGREADFAHSTRSGGGEDNEGENASLPGTLLRVLELCSLEVPPYHIELLYQALLQAFRATRPLPP